jgi:hypothetical protein
MLRTDSKNVASHACWTHYNLKELLARQPLRPLTARSRDVGGDFNFINGTNRNGIARLNPDGTTDASFNPGSGANGRVRSIALQSDGNVLIAGDFTAVDGMVRPYVARLYGDVLAPLPSLNIVRSNAFLVISWPLSATGFALDDNPTATGGWSQVAFPYSTNGNVISVRSSTLADNRFYRLRKP